MKKFKLLVLGSEPVFGRRTEAGKSFVEQLARRLVREGLHLTIECHAPISLSGMMDLLPRLPLQQYDLIILQPGQYECLRPASLHSLFTRQETCVVSGEGFYSPYRPVSHTDRFINRLIDIAKGMGLRLAAALTGLPRMQQIRQDLRAVLDTLQPCGHNVVLVTPFPHQDSISNWLRRKGRRLFLEEGYRAFMPVFDAYALLDVGDVCFLPDSQSELNPLGHELVGSALYDFFRAGVMVVGDSSSYRRHE